MPVIANLHYKQKDELNHKELNQSIIFDKIEGRNSKCVKIK